MPPSNRDIVLARGREDPAWFAEHVLRATPTDYQRAILRSLVVNRHTRVRSSHAVGKTTLAGMAVNWFLPTHIPSKVITTAPTARQVRTTLWGEVGRLYRQAAVTLAHRPPDTVKWTLGAEWSAEGFTAPANDPTRFQGHHSPNMLVVVDEACGISKLIYDEGVTACLTGGAHLLSIGNPTDPGSEFAKAFQDTAPGAFKISAFDTPNFTAFGITLDDIRTGAWVEKVAGRPMPRPYLVDPQWVWERYHRWGGDSPMFIGRVLAEFPDVSNDSLASLAWVTAAQERYLSDEGGTVDAHLPLVLGVDVARHGADSTVIYARRGRRCWRHSEIYGADTMAVTGHVIVAQRETGAVSARIDSIGIGAGVVDRLAELGHRWAQGVNFGEGASDSDRFKNVRAESYWAVREALERGELDIASDDFGSQITAIRWKPTSDGRIQIESKDEVKRRIGRSPDDADAVALTYSPDPPVLLW